MESVLKPWRRSVRNLRDIAEKQDGSGSGGGVGTKNRLVSRGLIKLAYLFVARPVFWAYASLQTASCWHLSHAELGTTQLHLKRTDSPCESLGSMHLMPQVAFPFPGTESIQFMTYFSPSALTRIECIQLISEAKNIYSQSTHDSTLSYAHWNKFDFICTRVAFSKLNLLEWQFYLL